MQLMEQRQAAMKAAWDYANAYVAIGGLRVGSVNFGVDASPHSSG